MPIIPGNVCICGNPECQVPYGFCHCGCGVRTHVAIWNNRSRGWIKDRPIQYRRGHQPNNGKTTQPRLQPRFERIDDVPCVWIPLTQRKWALIEEEDYALISSYNWHYLSGYAVRSIKDNALFMHSVLCPVEEGQEVDHVNGNKLDNRKNNLRPATRSQNRFNTCVSKNNRCGIKGITQTIWGNWQARISCNKHYIHLGTFATKEEAANAREIAELKYFGEFQRVA